jgi:ubiquinone/menaquinone biosynthesis C-methylase UbiE
MIKEKQAIQEAFDELSHRYEVVMDSELSSIWGWSYQKFLDELVSWTEFRENQQVLDIATGTAMIPRKVFKLGIPGLKIIGQDISEVMLNKGKQALIHENIDGKISLTCSDAMALPFRDQCFDVVVSGLSSHHMNIPIMLSEMNRILKTDGTLSLIDVGTSPLWETWIIKSIARVIGFFYFLFKENLHRAWAEAASVSNLRTPEGWHNELKEAGFNIIKIKKLKSKYKWIPEPLTITAKNL